MAGLHLLADCRARAHLNDRHVIEDWLRFAAAAAGMKVIGSQSHLLPTEYDAGPGVSAIILLAESHATIHTWSAEGILTMDFYSCRMFDPVPIWRSLAAKFDVTEWLVWQEQQRLGLDSMRVLTERVPDT